MVNESKMLTIKTEEEKDLPVIDSREVAEMLGKEHSYVLEMIQGRKGKLGIIPVLTNANLAVVNYFIESSYRDVKGEDRKCYLVTKMGCELLGNKQQGEKGILFTAKYVERFNQMEKALKSKTQFELPTSYVKIIEEQQSQIKNLANMVTMVSDDVKRIEACVGIRSKTVFNYTQYIKNSLGIKKVNDDYGRVKQRIFFEFHVTTWEQLTYSDEVINRIDEICKNYKPRKQKGLFDYFK